VVIKEIVPGGIADRNGHLRTGDHILQIGEVNIRGMTSKQVTQTFQQTGVLVRLMIARSVPEPPIFFRRDESIFPTDQLEKKIEHCNAATACLEEEGRIRKGKKKKEIEEIREEKEKKRLKEEIEENRRGRIKEIKEDRRERKERRKKEREEQEKKKEEEKSIRWKEALVDPWWAKYVHQVYTREEEEEKEKKEEERREEQRRREEKIKEEIKEERRKREEKIEEKW
jgi:hypothetical protein